MSDKHKIINLYTELAVNPNKDFGWEKGLENAKAHGYKQTWIDAIPLKVWDYCAAVGNPFIYADIHKGDTVLDLGCGAGVDVLVSCLHVGTLGKVIGVDITPKMVEKATEHAKLAGFPNVKILESSFDGMAIEDESIDVVISNGAINLTSCKESVFAEIYRVLKPNGKLYFADMIDISIEEDRCCSIEKSDCCDKNTEEDWANCVAGTMKKDELIEVIQNAGFERVKCTGLTHYTTSDTTQGATFTAKKVDASILREKHWENIFKSVDYTQVLWHQNFPKHSLDAIKSYSTSKNDAILDVGCGASLLVDRLFDDGFTDVTLLDTSKTSLNIVKKRHAKYEITPQYIVSDILLFQPIMQYDFWHDRAVFHFLLSKSEREQYFNVLSKSLKVGGIAILSTFAPNGQTACAGLSTRAYNKELLLSEIPKGLEFIASNNFIHVTPKQTEQDYSLFVLKKG